MTILHQSSPSLPRPVIPIRVIQAGLSGILCCLPHPVFAGTSHGSDEHLVIIGLAVFFAMLLCLYVLMRTMRKKIKAILDGAPRESAPPVEHHDDINGHAPAGHPDLRVSGAV